MSSVHRPSTIQDEAQIIGLLSRAFSLGSNAHLIEPDLLRWKYWARCEDWPEPRSWVAERGERIVAHLSLWPVTVRNGETSERGVTMIDWASDPGTPGAGVPLLQRLRKSYEFVYCIGGTAMTQSIVPRLGFSIVGEALTWARPLRPWRRSLRYPVRNLGFPVRVARNAWWSLAPPRTAGPGWSAIVTGTRGVGNSDDSPVPLFERGDGFFRYLEQCPVARCLTFHIVDEGRKVGWFALLVGRVQARVAGIWLEDPSAGNWRAAFLLAQRAALQRTDAYEIVARCGTEASSAGAEQAGMRVRKRVPVFLTRRGGGTDLLPLQYQLCDDDAVFLTIQSARFVT
jgi:hypothetical protein